MDDFERFVEEAEPVTAEEAQRAPRSRPRWVPWLAAAAAVLLVVGIGGLLTDEDDSQQIQPGSGEPLTLDSHRDWILDVLNGRREATDDAVRTRFSRTFLDAVPPDEVRATFDQIDRLRPWRILAELERHDDAMLVVQLVSDEGEQARLTLAVGPDGRIDGATILMATPCADRVEPDASLSEPLAQHLAWVLDLLASDRDLSDEEIAERFAPSFLDTFAPDELRSGLSDLRRPRPYSVRHFEGQPTERSLTARVGTRTGEEGRLTLSVDPEPPHRITALGIQMQPPCQITEPPG